MNKEEILSISRNSKEDERKIYIERQAFVNIVYTLLFIFLLFSFFKYICDQDFLDLNTIIVFITPAWTAFMATKYYYQRKVITLVFAIFFFIFSILSIINFFVVIFPLNIFR